MESMVHPNDDLISAPELDYGSENFRARPLFESIGRELAQGLESLSRFAKEKTPLAREDEEALSSLAC